MLINNEWPISAILRGSLHCTFEQPVSNILWIEPFFQIPGQWVLQGQHCIFNQLLSECLACVFVKRHSQLIVLFCIVLRRSSGLVGGIGQPGITVDEEEGVTQTPAPSLARSGITAIYYKALCVAGWSVPEETHPRHHRALHISD